MYQFGHKIRYFSRLLKYKIEKVSFYWELMFDWVSCFQELMFPTFDFLHGNASCLSRFSLTAERLARNSFFLIFNKIYNDSRKMFQLPAYIVKETERRHTILRKIFRNISFSLFFVFLSGKMKKFSRSRNLWLITHTHYIYRKAIWKKNCFFFRKFNDRYN